MKRITFIAVLVFICINPAVSKNWNRGGTKQKDYYIELPCRVVNNLCIVKVEINGKQYDFLLDTGAPTCVTESLLAEIGVLKAKKMLVNDSDGHAEKMKSFMLKSIVLGDVEFRNIPSLVLNQEVLEKCFNIQGIIGSNLLRNSVLQISPNDRKVIITDNPDKLALKDKEAFSSRMRLSSNQSSPHIFVTLNGGDSTTKSSIYVLLDSGMSGTFDMSVKDISRLKSDSVYRVKYKGLGSRSYGAFGLHKPSTQYILSTKRLQLNHAVFNNVYMTSTNDNRSRIGCGLFRHGVVTLDYISKRFYYQPLFDGEKDMYSKLIPVSSTVKDKKIVVGIVWLDSLKAEIETDDQIIAVNGVNYEGVDYCDFFNDKLKMPDTDEIELTLKDKYGVVKTITIYRQ